MTCFLRQFSSEPCSGGALVDCHLIRKNTLKNLLGGKVGARAARDPRTTVKGCGGYFGIAGHHHEFDHQGLVIPYSKLPEGFLVFLDEYGLGWYGPKHFPVEVTA